MKAFTFRLETALDLKTKQEEQHKEIIGKLQREYLRQKELLNSFIDKLLHMQEHIRSQQKYSIELLKIKTYIEYVPVLNNKISFQATQVEAVQSEINKARAILVSIMQERKILEKLKTKRYQEYQKLVLQQEQKDIDEMAINAYMSK